MPYGDLAAQSVQRFATIADLDTGLCTIEEREEYEPHIEAGTVVYAGVDYERILRRAESEADVILWDGGNNDTPFYNSDLEIVVADPHRAGHELAYFPGEVNLLRANVVVINKVNTATQLGIETVRCNVTQHNPKAKIFEVACKVSVPFPEQVRGKRVLVVEDGPTLTHGEMAYGAGVVAAKECGAAEIVDPRPYAAGSIRSTFERYSHLKDLLPAMGYSPAQRQELEETIKRVPCDLVLVATPIDLSRVIKLEKPALRVSYEVKGQSAAGLCQTIEQFSHRFKPSLVEL
jgi:predicted GTPase